MIERKQFPAVTKYGDYPAPRIQCVDGGDCDVGEWVWGEEGFSSDSTEEDDLGQAEDSSHQKRHCSVLVYGLLKFGVAGQHVGCYENG